MTDREQQLRDALRDWSEEAPHDPDLLGSVLAHPTAGRGSRRRVVRRVVAPVLAAGLVAAGVAVGLVVSDGPQRAVEPPPLASPSASATTCGTATPPASSQPPVPEGSEDPLDAVEWERGLSKRWGLKDIAVPSRAITETAATFPDADAGLTYDDATLTFTQWVVTDAADGPAMTAAVRSAFDEAAAGSNIRLDFGTSPMSEVAGRQLMEDLGEAYRNDPGWPAGVDLSGAVSPDVGRFELAAGERHDDPEVQAYFDDRWPCSVLLTSSRMVME